MLIAVISWLDAVVASINVFNCMENQWCANSNLCCGWSIQYSVSYQLIKQKSNWIFCYTVVKIPYRMPSSLNTSRQHRTMQWHTKWMDDAIITNTNSYYVGNQLSKATPFIGFPQAIMYQISNRDSHQYINYCSENSLLYCCSICLRTSAIPFLHKAIVHKSVFILLSNTG